MSVKERFGKIIHNKNTRRQLVFGLAAVLWMTVIFCFSARPADLSEDDSGVVTNLLAHIMHPGIDGWDLLIREETLEKMDTVVRKTAHFIEYAVLCGLLCGAFGVRPGRDTGTGSTGNPGSDRAYLKRTDVRIVSAFIISALYAVSDELHQLFVPGRSAMLKDVLIDAGGAAAAGIIIGILHLYRRPR